MTKKRRGKQEIYDGLKEKILYHHWKPGRSIREEEVAEELDVSRTPIREALLKLSDEGFVDIFPSKGTFVSKIDVSLLREYGYMRHVVECDVLLGMAKKQQMVKAACEEVLLLQQMAIKRGDIKGYVKQDHAFHWQLFVLAGHGVLWPALETFYAHTIRYHMLDFETNGYMETSIQEHQTILETMEKGETGPLLAALKQHHDSGFLEAEQLRQKYPDYFV